MSRGSDEGGAGGIERPNYRGAQRAGFDTSLEVFEFLFEET